MRKWLMRWCACAAGLAAALSVGAFAAEVGVVETTLSQLGCLYEQCELGSVTADAVRWEYGVDFAVIPGGVFYQNLQGGPVTEERVAQSFYSDEEIALCRVTAPQLKAMMEIGVSHIAVGTGDTVDTQASAYEGFLQISGFQVKCDYSAAVGERVLWLKTDQGVQLDLEDQTTTYTLAAPARLLDGAYGYEPVEAEPSKTAMLECLCAYIQNGLARADGDRYIIIGVQGNLLMQNVSPLIPVLLVVMFLVVGCMTGGKVKRAGRTRKELE